MSKTNEAASVKVITPVGILSYPFLFKPQQNKEGGDPKYSCAVIFEAGTDLTALKSAILTAAKAKWGDKAEALLRGGKIRSPLRSDPDDVAEKGYPEGSAFFNARTKAQPQVVSRFLDPNTGKATVIEDPAEVYAGCKVRVSVTAFAYDREGNRGVGLGLNNVQKWADGERIDGRRAATDEFSADLQQAPASLDDLK